MAQRELYNSLTDGKVQHVAPVVATADINQTGTGVDLAGYNSALVEYSVGIEGFTLTATDKITATLKESDEASANFTDVAAADMKGSLTVYNAAGTQPAVNVVAYLGSKRYILAGYDFAGTHTTGTPVAVTVLRGHKRNVGNG